MVDGQRVFQARDRELLSERPVDGPPGLDRLPTTGALCHGDRLRGESQKAWLIPTPLLA